MKLSFYRLLVLIAVVLWTSCLPGTLVRAQDNDSEARRHFMVAREAQNSGDLDSAAKEYLAVLRLQPDVAEVYANLGLVRHMQANFEDSARALQKALALKPELLGLNLFLGIDYVKLNQSARAVPHLMKAVQQEPGNKEAAAWLGTALWDAGRTTAALTQLRKASAAFPTDCDLLFLLGEAYQKAANQELERVVTTAVGTPLYHQAFGDVYADQHVWGKAIGHYQAALEKDPLWKGAHLRLGDAYFRQGKLEEAQTEFQRELKTDPSSAATLAKLAELAILKDQAEEVLQKLDAAIRLAPEQAASALGLPPIPSSDAADKPDIQRQKHYQQALVLLKSTQQSASRDLALAVVFDRLDLHDEYSVEWKRFLDAAPRFHSANAYKRAMADFDRHDFQSAQKDFETLLLADSRNMKIHYLASRTYQYLSLSVLDRMLALDPNFYRGHQLLAKTFERREENEKALAEYRIVEQIKPALSGLHYAIGHLLWTMNESEQALVELGKELRLNPDHPEANAEMGTILVARHEEEKAIPYLYKALHLKPELLTARQQLGMAFYRTKDFARAEQELKKGTSSDSEGTAHFILGMVYQKMGRVEQSQAALEESRRIRAERLAEVKIQKQEPTQ